MLYHYLIMTLRMMRRDRVYALINIFGLAVGIACFLLIVLYVQDELSYDRYHQNADRIYRVVNGTNAQTPQPLAPTLQSAFPEVLSTVRLVPTVGSWMMRYQEKVFSETLVSIADSTLFEMFTIPLIKGDPRTALQRPHAVVISEAMATKYFGDSDPMGKIIRADDSFDLQVTGVMSPMPRQSHFQADFFVSKATQAVEFPGEWEEESKNWQSSRNYTYILLPRGYPAAELEQKLQRLVESQLRPQIQAKGITFDLSLQPLTAIYLYSHLEHEAGPNGDITTIYVLCSIVVFTLLIACINYMNLSTARAVRRAKGAAKGGGTGTTLRKALVVVQFAISIAILIGTSIVYTQLDYLRNKRLGFDKDHVIVISSNAGPVLVRYDLLKQELLRHSSIVGVTSARYLPGRARGSGRLRTYLVHPEGWAAGRQLEVQAFEIDFDFIKTLGLELAAGRDLSRELLATDINGFLLNETAVARFGWTSPEAALGKQLEVGGVSGGNKKKGPVIGVVRDFHLQSLHQRIEPLILTLWGGGLTAVRVQSNQLSTTVQIIQDAWKKINPDYPLLFSFLNDDVDRLYRAEERLSRLCEVFAGIAIFIACLGLFGLTSFTTQQRTKEIGIRKVVGASITNIVLLLSRELTTLVVVANVIAWPVAYVVMNRWLQRFAYRIDLGVEVFVLAGLAALVIALLTVSVQTINAARANPVDSLRYE